MKFILDWFWASDKDSLIKFSIFMAIFHVINFTNALIKCNYVRIHSTRTPAGDLTSVLNNQFQTNKFDKFWTYFALDFLTYQIPIIFYITILSDYVLWVYVSFLVLVSVLFQIIIREANGLRQSVIHVNCDVTAKTLLSLNSSCNSGTNNDSHPFQAVNVKLIKLSINSFRTLLFLITSAAILAVDFSVFPRRHGKTNDFGFSLMDIGVGFFVMCHAMRIIRNDGDTVNSQQTIPFYVELRKFPMKFYKTVKHSSLLLAIGMLRLILVRITNYNVSYSEYGLHWNFFFTIFFVKIATCPLELLTRRKASRAFLLSLLIGGSYQYYLSLPGVSDYMLNKNNVRNTLVDKNKEGIFSTFGYVSIYLASEAICYTLKKIMVSSTDKTRSNSKYDASIKCVYRLYLFALFYWLMAEVTRYAVQDSSRKIGNLAFTFFILMTGTFLWAFVLLGNIMLTKVFERLLRAAHGGTELVDSDLKQMAVKLIALLERCFSFVEIVDSKLIGLIIFLVANLLTGVVNLTIRTRAMSHLSAIAILIMHSFFSILFPYFTFYYFRVLRSTRK